MTIKCAQADEAKTEYANQLQKTNNLQMSHYGKSLPEVKLFEANFLHKINQKFLLLQVFNKLQEIDEKRTRGIKEFIKSAADVESSVATIIAKCLEGVVKASESINEKEDSLKVIEK